MKNSAKPSPLTAKNITHRIALFDPIASISLAFEEGAYPDERFDALRDRLGREVAGVEDALRMLRY